MYLQIALSLAGLAELCRAAAYEVPAHVFHVRRVPRGRSHTRHEENDLKQAGSVADPLWYKDAIIYELHVRAFIDSNDDGIGDFPGLMQKLDYLRTWA